MIKTPRINNIDKTLKKMTESPIQIKTIFETTDDRKRPNYDSLLYQDILKFGLRSSLQFGFRFTDLANWLVEHNQEILADYADSKSHVRKSARVANRRDRIQRHIDKLEASDLIVQKAVGPAEKNDENIPLYCLTMEGRLLALLIECKDISDTGMKIGDSSLFHSVLEAINSSNKTKESFSLIFINNFFKNCAEIGIFSDVIRFFVDVVLSDSAIDRGRDLLGLFLGLDRLLYWLASQSQIFIKTLKDLDLDTKKIILFQLKMEIEQYHHMNYLTNDWWNIWTMDVMYGNSSDIKDIQLKNGQVIKQIDTRGDCSHMTIIPSSDWQMMRYNNINNYSTVCIPGLCINCRSEQPFTVDILEYLYSIASMVKDGSYGTIKTNCDKCNGKDQVLSFVVRFPGKVLFHLHPEHKYLVSTWNTKKRNPKK
jgi:hypothetical protein